MTGTSAEGCSYLVPNSAKHAFQGTFPQQEAQTAEFNTATGACVAQAGEGRTAQLSSKGLLFKDTAHNKRELGKQNIKLDRMNKGSWDKAKKTTDR